MSDTLHFYNWFFYYLKINFIFFLWGSLWPLLLVRSIPLALILVSPTPMTMRLEGYWFIVSYKYLANSWELLCYYTPIWLTLKSFWILYIDQIIVYNTFYSTLTFYIIKDRCQMHALKVFRSPVWLLLHKLSSPHYRYIRKMRRGDRLPLTQCIITEKFSGVG
jgi:hypothetical protein